MTKDLFEEFDEAYGQTPRDKELMELGVEPDEFLPAQLAPPALKGALVKDPRSGRLGYAASSWKDIQLPDRLKAFYLWVDLGDYTRVAAEMGVKVSSIRTLADKDQWQARVGELRAHLDGTISTLWLESRRAGHSFFLEYLQQLDPCKMAALSGPAEVAQLMRAITGMAGGGGPSIMVAGNAQINTGGSQGQMVTGSKPAQALTDSELLAEAQRLGVKVQPAPVRVRSDASVVESGQQPSP